MKIKKLPGISNALANSKKYFCKSLKAIQTSYAKDSIIDEIKVKKDELKSFRNKSQFALKLDPDPGAIYQKHIHVSKGRPVNFER